jgi:sugar lactone lactonase YvrE
MPQRLNAPYGAYTNGTKLYIADFSHSRIVGWNTFPTVNAQVADFALGQPSTNTGIANNGGLSATSMQFPSSVFSDGTKLFVSDNNNNRVLVWNALPNSSGQAADFALGQPDLASNTANNGGLSGSTLSGPHEISILGTKLFMADQSNHRVLVWNSIPSSNGTSADFALGQPNLTSNTSNNGGISSSSLNQPWGIFSDGSNLYVSDTYNHRILVWNSAPTSTSSLPISVLGQPNFNSNLSNNPDISRAYQSNPSGVFSDGTRLFVADTNYNRVLVWNSLPTSNGEPASFVLGQPDATSNSINTGGVSGSSLNQPKAIFSDGTRLYVCDTTNNRVLVWNTMPTSNGESASFALGQNDLISNSANNGGIITASSLRAPSGVYSDGTHLFVSDFSNNRVLLWNTIPTGFAQPASLALGQPDLVSGTVNNGGLSSSSLRNPGGIFSNGTKLIVSDETNSRVLIWNSIPVANKQAADLVLGQSTFLTSTSNNGGISASTMNRPKGVFWDGSHLAVADNLNYRVLVWNSFPTANGQAADTVIGQSNFVSRVFRNGGVSSTGFGSAVGLFSDGTRLMISNSSEFRILFTPIPGI